MDTQEFDHPYDPEYEYAALHDEVGDSLQGPGPLAVLMVGDTIDGRTAVFRGGTVPNLEASEGEALRLPAAIGEVAENRRRLRFMLVACLDGDSWVVRLSAEYPHRELLESPGAGKKLATMRYLLARAEFNEGFTLALEQSIRRSIPDLFPPANPES